MPPDQLNALVGRLHQLISSGDKRLIVFLGAGASQPNVLASRDMAVRAQAFAEYRPDASADASSRPRPQPASVAGGSPQEETTGRYIDVLSRVERARGRDGVLAIIQDAVLHAYRGRKTWALNHPTPMPDAALAGLEMNTQDWRVPDGLRAFVDIAREHPQRVSNYVFTTNFDPLLEIAFRDAGIDAKKTVFGYEDTDGFDHFAQSPADTHVIHLHGDAYRRTAHVPWLVARDRPRLEQWLASTMNGALVLVVGYSGWDELFRRILRQRTGPPGFELLWAVYEDQEQHRRLNSSLDGFFSEHEVTVTPFYQIDGNRLFVDLRDSLRNGDAGSPRRSRPPNSPTFEITNRLCKEFGFGMSHVRHDAAPRLMFWPHRLREPHLIHGVHALTAMLFARRDVEVALHLDDTHISRAQADEQVRNFTDAVTTWFDACGVRRHPVITRTSELIDLTGPERQASAERLWRLAEEFFSPDTTAFDALLATKTLDPAEPGKLAPRASAQGVLRPLYTWLALEKAAESRSLPAGEPAQIITLGGQDEQKMWDLWHARSRAPAIGNVYVKRLDTPAAGADLWDYEALWRDTPYGRGDLARFIRRMAQVGSEGESVLDWMYFSAIKLAALASDGVFGDMRHEGTSIRSWGEAVDLIRRVPYDASEALASAISAWFHP